MNLDVAINAIGVLRVQVVLRPGWLLRADSMRAAVTGETELGHFARYQQTRISRAMRRVARNTAISLYWSMLVDKRTLLISVTFNTGRVGAGGKSSLFQLKAAMWVVAIAALHGAFENLVMKRQHKLVFGLGVTAQAELRLALFQQTNTGESWLLSVGLADEHV